MNPIVFKPESIRLLSRFMFFGLLAFMLPFDGTAQEKKVFIPEKWSYPGDKDREDAEKYPSRPSNQIYRWAKENGAEIISQKEIKVEAKQNRHGYWFARAHVEVTYRLNGEIDEEGSRLFARQGELLNYLAPAFAESAAQFLRQTADMGPLTEAWETGTIEAADKTRNFGAGRVGRAVPRVGAILKGTKPMGYANSLFDTMEKVGEVHTFAENIQGQVTGKLVEKMSTLGGELEEAMGATADAYNAMSPAEKVAVGTFLPREAAKKLLAEKAARGEMPIIVNLAVKMQSTPDRETIKALAEATDASGDDEAMAETEEAPANPFDSPPRTADSQNLELMNNQTKSGKPLGTGDIQFTLNWTGAPDVDLHVTDPSGETINYNHKASQSGGKLDVDDKKNGGPENIFWPAGKAPKGKYKVEVVLYNGSSANWTVRMKIDGNVSSASGTLNGSKARKVVTEFTYN